MLWQREIYASPNGDRWFLAQDTAADYAYILHYPNKASGGRPTEIDIGPFLMTAGRGPEHQELLRLIGTLAEGCTPVANIAEYAHSQWVPANELH